jgi:hypothetical protein
MKKRKRWWLEPGSEAHRCVRVILGEGQPGGRRCRYKAHLGGVCKVHLRYDPLPPMPAAPEPASPDPSSMTVIDEARPRAKVKPEALLERRVSKVPHDAGMSMKMEWMFTRKQTITAAMMREAAGVLARVASAFERSNTKAPHERTETEAMQASMDEQALRAVLFVRRRELQSAVERCVDYCMAGTIRIAEHDLQGVMNEKAALAANLTSTQELATTLAIEGRRYRAECVRLLNDARKAIGFPPLDPDAMTRHLEAVRIGNLEPAEDRIAEVK